METTKVSSNIFVCLRRYLRNCYSTFAAIAAILVCSCDCEVLSALSICLEMMVSDWLSFIRDFRSHAIVRKISNIANSPKSHCERSHGICERSHANFKQRIACDLRIANEVEMGLKKRNCFIVGFVQ